MENICKCDCDRNRSWCHGRVSVFPRAHFAGLLNKEYRFKKHQKHLGGIVKYEKSPCVRIQNAIVVVRERYNTEESVMSVGMPSECFVMQLAMNRIRFSWGLLASYSNIFGPSFINETFHHRSWRGTERFYRSHDGKQEFPIVEKKKRGAIELQKRRKTKNWELVWSGEK